MRVANTRPSRFETCEHNIMMYLFLDRPLFFTSRMLFAALGKGAMSKGTTRRVLKKLEKLGIIGVRYDHWGNVYIPNYRDKNTREAIEQYLPF